jgi:uncharacterized protein
VSERPRHDADAGRATPSRASAVHWFKRWNSRPHGAAQGSIEPPVSAPTRLLILQPTPFCNIDCDYCYLPGRDQKHRMSIDTVRLAAVRLRDDGLAPQRLTVVWHAGEPLTLPVAYYDDAFATLAEVFGPQTRVDHAIQTNATLIDGDWCALFARHGVRVGVSIDGPADLHDAHRRTRSGRGTHAAALRGLQCLREHGIAAHAIAVVTRDTLARADDFYDFFVAQGIGEVGCNFDEAEGGHETSSLAGHEAAHAGFLRRLMQRSAAGGQRLVMRELAHAQRLIAQPLPRRHWGGRDWPDNAQVLPWAMVTVAWNGDFCTFSPELLGQPSPDFGDFVLGNVNTGGYIDSMATPAFQRLWQAVAAGVQACGDQCAYFDHCGGGAPVNKLYENGDIASAQTLYCRSMMQRPFDVVLEALEQRRASRAAVGR